MGRPPPKPPALDPVEDLIQRLRSVRSEAERVVADPRRRKSVWAKTSDVGLAEAEQELALACVIQWLGSRGGDWFDTRALRALYLRLRNGNRRAEEERRQACRELVLAAFAELTSRKREFGPDRMTLHDAAVWIARRLPAEIGPIVAGRQASERASALAIIRLRDRARRTNKSKGDTRLAEDVEQRLTKLGGISRDGKSFRQRPRTERAQGILDLLREAFPA